MPECQCTGSLVSFPEPKLAQLSKPRFSNCLPYWALQTMLTKHRPKDKSRTGLFIVILFNYETTKIENHFIFLDIFQKNVNLYFFKYMKLCVE